MSGAAQVNACPQEEELKYTYNGYCSDSAKAYANQTDSCIRYEDYRVMKNVALWESKDGVFDGYVSCDLPPAQADAPFHRQDAGTELEDDAEGTFGHENSA